MSAAVRPLVLRGALLHDPDRNSVGPGDLLILDGVIRALSAPGLAVPEGTQEFDAQDRLALPGFVNMHSHGHGAMGRGLLPERAGLESFLAGGGPLMAGRSLEEIRLGGIVNALEMLRHGITTCFDMFSESPLPSAEGLAALGDAYAGVGMRAVLAPMVSDRTIWQALPQMMQSLPPEAQALASAAKAQPTGAVLSALVAALEGWSPTDPLIGRAIAPTIPLHCSEELMRGCTRLALDLDLPMQIHLAETRAQALAGQDLYGCSLTAWLHRLGVLGPRLSLAHGVWLSEADMGLIAAAGASVVHNPGSNLRLGSGIADVPRLRAAGVNVCLGTDGCNTSDHASMFEVQRLAAGLSRVTAARNADWLGASDALAMATTAGAAALGMQHRIGRLAVGYQADIQLIDLSQSHYWPLRDPVSQMVFAEDGTGVSDVFVAGRHVFAKGSFPGLDLVALRARVQAAADDIAERSAAARKAIGIIEAPIAGFTDRTRAASCCCPSVRPTPS